MTRVFVFTNHKGGVGKSTSATNTALGLAGVLRRAGASNSRVLLIDTDSQAHATLVTTGHKEYGTDDSLYSVLMADRQNVPQVLANCIVQSNWDADLQLMNLLAGVTADLLAGNPQQFEDTSLRVARILLEMVRPDPVQPRRVLPEQLHFAFHNNRLTPTQALKELVQLVQVAARQRGRPFVQ